MTRNSQDALFESWATMVRNVRKNKGGLAGVEPFLGALEKAYHGAVANRSQSEGLRAASQEATQQLQASLTEARDAAIRLRSFIKSKLGIHSAQLVAFGIKPIRKRGSRRKAVGEGIAN
jgi:hypothetical protein